MSPSGNTHRSKLSLESGVDLLSDSFNFRLMQEDGHNGMIEWRQA